MSVGSLNLSMTTWTYFLWLCNQAIPFFLFAWPVTGTLAGLLAVGLVRARRSPFSVPFSRWWLQITPLIVPVAVLAVGAVFACENCSPSALGEGIRHPWAGDVVGLLFLGQCMAAAWLVRQAEGRRFVSSSLQALQLWFTMSACFVATMSISGDWL